MATVRALGDRRRLFWATQPDVTPDVARCDQECNGAGLEIVAVDTRSSTISTEEYVRGLAMNMLLTDGQQPARTCGYQPGSRGGHWSESFINGINPSVGTLLRTIDGNFRTVELQALIQAQAEATLRRLIDYGVASEVKVRVDYIGGGRYTLEAIVFGVGNDTARVGLTGEQLENGWVWRN